MLDFTDFFFLFQLCVHPENNSGGKSLPKRDENLLKTLVFSMVKKNERKLKSRRRTYDAETLVNERVGAEKNNKVWNKICKRVA